VPDLLDLLQRKAFWFRWLWLSATLKARYVRGCITPHSQAR